MQFTRVDTKGAALVLGLSAGTLEVWRCLGKGPRFKKIGRKVFYELADLEAFANSNVIETIDSMNMR